MDLYAQLAIDALNRAGHAVTPADRDPGLYDVAGVARDVTIGQLWQLSHGYGQWGEGPRNAFNVNAFGMPPRG